MTSCFFSYLLQRKCEQYKINIFNFYSFKNENSKTPQSLLSYISYAICISFLGSLGVLAWVIVILGEGKQVAKWSRIQTENHWKYSWGSWGNLRGAWCKLWLNRNDNNSCYGCPGPIRKELPGKQYRECGCPASPGSGALEETFVSSVTLLVSSL